VLQPSSAPLVNQAGLPPTGVPVPGSTPGGFAAKWDGACVVGAAAGALAGVAGLVGFSMTMMARIPVWSNSAYVQGIALALFAVVSGVLGVRFWSRARRDRSHTVMGVGKGRARISLFAASLLFTQLYFLLRVVVGGLGSPSVGVMESSGFTMILLFTLGMLSAAALLFIEAVDLSARPPVTGARRSLDGLSGFYIVVGLLVALLSVNTGLQMAGV
jgi:hypothetical protein